MPAQMGSLPSAALALAAVVALTLVIIMWLSWGSGGRELTPVGCGFTNPADVPKKKGCKRLCPGGEGCVVEDGKEWCHRHTAEEKDPWDAPGSPPAPLKAFIP